MKSFFKFMLASMAGFFLSITIVLIIGGIFLVAIVMGLGSKPAKPRKDMVLEITLDYPITEQTDDNPLLTLLDMDDKNVLGLDELLYQIDRASNDDNVKGILLRPGMFSAGYATVEEIRNAITSFRKKGKFVYAYCDYLTTKNYFLATSCDSIFLNPAGEIILNGLSSNVMLYKGMFDKLGITMELFKVGTHKGAAEAYTQDSLSTENKEQIMRFISLLQDEMCGRIATSRNLNANTLKQDINAFNVQSPQQALQRQWIDALWYQDELGALIKSKLGKDVSKKLCFTSLSEYRRMKGPDSRNNDASNKIAVVYLEGEITANTSSDNLESGSSLMKGLRKIRYENDYKALVIRINSPGGSAYASDQIWREISLIQQKKPVIVSMGDVAASGGYYIAAPADTIVVSPFTLTGSIGVFALYPNMKEFLNNKIGIRYESVKTGEFASLGLPDKGFSDKERPIIQAAVNRVYHNFTRIVAEGRHLDSLHVEDIAQGKVWIARDAIQHRLADVYGSFQDAIDIACHKAGLDSNNYAISIYPKKETGISSLLSIYQSVKQSRIQQQMGALYPLFDEIQKVEQMKGMQMKLPYILQFND